MRAASFTRCVRVLPDIRAGRGPGFAELARRDVFAFVAICAFMVELYTVPGEWISGFEHLRLALVLSILAASLVVLRRVGRVEPIYFDGVRGGALLAFAGLSAGSLAWAINPAVTRDYIPDLLKLVAIYLTLINVVNTPRRLVVACGLLVLASIVTSIGVIHWYHRGIDLVEGFRARWYGVYADPNHMAENLGIILPMAVAFVARRRTPKVMRLLCALAAVLATTAIVFSHSRGGFVGLSVAMTVWALREREYRGKAILLGVALAMGLVLLAPKSFWERNDTLGDFHEDASAQGRVYAWHVASAISLDKPLLGVGAGGFRYAWFDYAPPDSHQAYVAHNIYLDVMGETGWIGLLFFLIFSGGATGGAFNASRDPEIGWIARGLAAAMVGYLLCNCFSGYTLSTHLYVLFGLAACAERIAVRAAAREQAPVPGPAVLVPAVSPSRTR